MMNTGTKARRSTRKLAGAMAALATAAAAHGQTVFYVDDDAPTGGNGQSWGQAFHDLQDALWAASFIWEDVEIRIAEGIYTPDRGTGLQEASFRIDHIGSVSSGSTFGFGLSLKGAFAGIIALDPSERDTHKFKSILSGDLNGDDQPGFIKTEDNSYHIFQMVNTPLESVELDGLVFQGGNALAPYVFDRGAALNIQLRSNAVMPVFIRHCAFIDNRAHSGSAVFIDPGPSPIFMSHCFFGNNHTDGNGGALQLSSHDYGDLALSNCVFSGNSAESSGGAISQEGELRIYSCTFFGNSANNRGGAIDADSDDTTIYNSVLFSNGNEPIYPLSRIDVLDSCIEGGYPGWRNISTDPLLKDAVGDDGILGTLDDNLMPRFGSPVIDAGRSSSVINPNGFDFAGNRRIVDDPFTPNPGPGIAPVVDMGAYEFQSPTCYADLDHSTGVGTLDIFDFLRFQQLFVMNDSLACQVDRSSGNNICDIFDFLAFQSEFAAGCP